MRSSLSQCFNTTALLLMVSATGLGGCVSARMSDRESDRLFREQHYDEAAEHLQKGLEKEGEGSRDELLYLLDLGLALHSAGKYQESNKALMKADKLAEINDYTSLTKEAATLVTSDNMKAYKGEDFENVLISAYLSINYVMMGDYENSLVEARRVNRKLQLMVQEGQRKYKQNAFARYLSAVIYEAEGNWNDAYVDYKNTYKLEPEFPGLGRDLWRMAYFLHMDDQMDEWTEKFKLTPADFVEAKKLMPKAKKAEIVVIYENGISPVKKPSRIMHNLPEFSPRYNPVTEAEVQIDGKQVGRTAVLHDVESTAINNLKEKFGAIFAKKAIGGTIAKGIIASQLSKKNELLGAVAWAAMWVGDQADVRSWNLLPKDLQVARYVVEPGAHTVKVLPGGGDSLTEKTVQVGPGKKAFVNFRYMP